MNTLKRLEHELILDWHRLQMETIPAVKTAALRAYYEKYAQYRKSRVWNLEMFPAARVVGIA